jgi:hypothetical protein
MSNGRQIGAGTAATKRRRFIAFNKYRCILAARP